MVVAKVVPAKKNKMLRVLIVHTDSCVGENIIHSLKKCNQQGIHAESWNAHSNSLELHFAILFDVIIVDSVNFSFQDNKHVGNVLADFVDAGKGLVCTLFSNYTVSNQKIAGRFEMEHYHPLTYGFYEYPSDIKMGKRVIPHHELLVNVTKFSGSSASLMHCELDESILVATLENEMPLIAYKQKAGKGMVVALNTLGVNNLALNFAWDANTDGHWILYNAVLFAAGRKPFAMFHKNLFSKKCFQDVIILFL